MTPFNSASDAFQPHPDDPRQGAHASRRVHRRGSVLLASGDDIRDARGDHGAHDGALQHAGRPHRRRRRV
eukprot:29591-Pelagococcus_subviridis.AAC.5